MNIKPMKNFLKRRNLGEKIFIGVSSLILIFGTIDAIGEKIYKAKNKKMEVVKETTTEIKDDSKIEKSIEQEKQPAKTVEQVEAPPIKEVDKVALPATSNLEKIKADFAAVYSDSKVTSISKNGSTLNISIQESESEFNLPVDETAISVYTEEALDNVGDDIETLDITVKRPNSSARAKLDMNRLITTNLGSYFDIEYIMKNMY